MNDIAQARIRKARAAGREAETAVREKVPFKNGNFLAIVYSLLFAGIAIALKNWLECDARFGHVYLGDKRRYLWYDVSILFTALLTGRYILRFGASAILKRNSRLLMLFCVGILDLLVISVMFFALSRGFVEKDFGITPKQVAAWAPFLLPALLTPALTTLLTDTSTGRAACISIAIAHAIFVPVEAALPVFLMCLIPSYIKLRHIAKVRRRSQLLAAFAQGIPAKFLGSLLLLASAGPKIVGYSNEGMALVLCAVLTVISVAVSYVVTILALPVFEHIFAACSNIKLNNYADLEHPILRILSNDAPGTYQHATKVADLAFEAAEKIGANPLLCRVGAYFHDIGKIDNPRYFGENLGFNEQNPHDKLPPSMSASILEAHIKQGLAHADANNFPPELRRIIKEHHGTTVKDYFLFKAREQAKLKALETRSEPERVDESSFRYDSDKPTVKETGILLLADSVEAATRSLENVTPQVISSIVEDITKKKINDGQFDECPLSFTEINTIKKSFIVTLQHILHNRIAYPK